MRSSAPDSGTVEGAVAFASGDQRRIRPTAPISDLSDYLVFLREIEEVFGPTVRPRRIAGGNRFLL